MEKEKKENLENNKTTSKKKHGFLYYFLNVLFYSVCAAVISFAVLNSIDQNTSYSFLPNHTAVIISPSMSRIHEDNLSYLNEEETQHIQVNDVIYTTNYKSYEDIQLNDVAVYIGEKGTMVCHRVIEKYEDEDGQFIVTRGDANNTSDAPVNYSAVRGKVINVIPQAGKFIGFTKSVYFAMAICFSMFFVFLGMYLYNLKTDKETEQVEEEQSVRPIPQEVVEESAVTDNEETVEEEKPVAESNENVETPDNIEENTDTQIEDSNESNNVEEA